MKQNLLKSMLLLCALIVGSLTSWAADKITDVAYIKDGGHYFIGCTVSEADYYLYVNPTSSDKGQKKTTTDEATEFIFTSGTSGGWYIQIASSGKYISLPTSKDNAKVNVQDEPDEWEATNVSSLIQLKINGFVLQGNNSSSLNFGSYASGQTNVWLLPKDDGGSSAPENEVRFSYEDYKGWANSPDYGKEVTLPKTDVDITNNWFYTPQGYSYVQFTATNGTGTVTITPKNDATVTKVVISANAEFNGGEITPSTGTVSKNTEGTVITWVGEASTAFTLKYKSHIRWTSIVVTYTGGLPTCETPVISGESPFVTYTTVSITCPTEGATIWYSKSTDGVNYTNYQPYAAPFQLSETTQVRAYATKDGLADSKEVYKVFTQQGFAPNIKYFISDRANSGTLEFVKLEDALVTYKNGTTAYIEDAYGAVMLYKCVGENLAAGDKINGYMHVTGYTVYNGLPEITGFELVEGYTKTSGNTVTPTVVTIAQLTAGDDADPYESYLSKYIKIENATVTSAFASKNCTISDGTNEIILHDNGSSTLTSTVNDVVTVTGHIAIYGTTKQIAVYEQSQITEGEAPAVPTVTVTPASLTGFTYVVDNGPSAAQSFTVSGTNLTADISINEDDNNYEFSLAEADGYTKSLTLTPTEGAVAATTIYVRLKAGLPVDASYGGTVVISSTEVSAKTVTLSGSVKEPSIDYATLPFEWAGGPSADFKELNGVTTDGLGSDYAEGNKPYLIKLDGTGDYIQVKTDSQPGTVIFGVKMIGGANDSKITVQESVDGETFTDVEEFTISGKQNDILEFKTTKAFAADSRYVRLTFTKGSNVGVGPITISKAEAPSTEPSIAVSTTNVNVLAAGEEGTIKVTYNNITDVVAEVVFCNSIGEDATYDWITAEINESNNIDYLVEANTALEARTAYLKVHALDDDANDVYSEIITIIQNRYVVDYATLPFEFDGGKADIAEITGLTQDGLDSDYGSSPKLKFNGSGDEVVLKINEVPGTLFFDIKGNGFSGSTFTVQTSANGKTYTDLATYTELGGTQTESFELDADVRYIKWVYTEKVNGNVALGNIKLTNASVITISESLYATYCNPTKALSFTGSGVTAYVVRLVQDYTAYIEEVPEVPANTPIIVRADAAGSYDVTITESADAVGTNMLKVSDGTMTGGDGIYALADKGNGVGFYPVPTSITIPNGKCYLDTNSTGTKAFLGFGEFETAIKNVIVNESENAIYNIAGQRMSKMQKGVNIVNGKKVLK